MAERQKHGFIYQDYICDKYHIKPSLSYTDKWDGITLNGVPVSIKVEKKGSDVELADYFRNANINEDFYLIVGFWQDDKTNIVEDHILLIKGNEWHSLFPVEFETKFKSLLANITNSYEDDAKWKQNINSLRNEWKLVTTNLIRPRFKRDHKTQKRIQCAINNKDFYSYFIPKYEVINVG